MKTLLQKRLRKALLLAGLISSVAPGRSQAQTVDVRTGLISYWPMTTVNGTTTLTTPDLVSGYDMVLSSSSGHAMSATNFLAVTNNTATGPAHGLPLNTKAAYVNGTQWLQYSGTTNGATALPISYQPSFSVLFWVRGASQSSGGADRIFADTYSVLGDTIPINSISANAAAFQLFNRIQGPANGTTWTFNTTGSGLDNTWHHIAWIVSNFSQTVYIDDTLVLSPTAAGSYNQPNPTINSATSPVDTTALGGLIRGNANGGGSLADFYTGQFTDVAIWNRALSKSEIGNVMSNSINLSGLTAAANPGGAAYYFGSQPIGSQSVPASSSVGYVLSAAAFGPAFQGQPAPLASQFNYQWYHNGNPLFDDGVNVVGAASSQLSLSNLSAAANNGNYYVIATATETNVSVTSSNASLNVVAFTPSFIANPVGTTNLWVGDSWTMSGSASYDTGSTVGYQWLFNGVPLTDGTSPNGYTISGSATSTLALSDLDPAAATGNYALVLDYTNAATGSGAITSAVAHLTVLGSETVNLTNGLIAYWPLSSIQGTKTPDVLNGQDLTVFGPVVNTADRNGGTNAFAFSRASSTYLGRTDATNDLLPACQYPAYTVSCWVMGQSQLNDNTGAFWSEGSTSGNGPLIMFIGDPGNNGKVNNYLRYNGGQNGGYGDNELGNNVALDGNWHHYVYVSHPEGTNFPGPTYPNQSGSTLNVTYSQNMESLVYLDGQIDGAPVYQPFPLTNGTAGSGGGPMNVEGVGCLNRTGPGDYFNGSVSELAIWSRPLSPAEVQALYSSGLPPITPNVPLMTISSFTADTPDAVQGGSVTLHWNASSYATALTISSSPTNQVVGNVLPISVAGAGTITLTNLKESTTYTLTASRGTNVATASVYVGVISGVNPGWRPLDTFDTYAAGPLANAAPWWKVAGGDPSTIYSLPGGNRLLQPGTVIESYTLSMPALIYGLQSNTLTIHESTTLFFRFVTGSNIMDSTGTTVLNPVQTVVGLSDYSAKWYPDALNDFGPSVLISTDSGVLAVGALNGVSAATTWTTGLSWADNTPLVIENNSVYDVWLDVTNSDITAAPNTYNVWLAPETNLTQKVEIFTGFTSDRDPTGAAGAHGDESQNMNVLCVAGASFNSAGVPQVLFDDFYLSATNAYNGTLPRPFGLTSAQGVPPVLTLTPVITAPGQVNIYWSGGTLISAPTLNGPWTPVAGANVPFYTTTTTSGTTFFAAKAIP